MDYIDIPPPVAGIRRALRLIGWNVLIIVAGAAVVGLAGEAYLRLTVPFMESSKPLEFVPNAGYLRPPNTEIRHTNGHDFWTVSRANSLGFLDREPPSPERAATTCHVSVIGDSFVEAPDVPNEDKLQVRLEELAASRLPRLEVTTSAFGMGNTGQVQQLPFYDEYVRRLRPKLLVLVFVANDFRNNTPLLRSLGLLPGGRKGPWEPMVRKRPDGELELAWAFPKDQIPEGFWPQPSGTALAGRKTTAHLWKAMAHSWFALWLSAKKKALFPPPPSNAPHRFSRKREALMRQPGYAAGYVAMFEGWRPTRWGDVKRGFARRDLPPFYEDALQYTRFALEQFKQRADRDGAKLVVLATHTLKTPGTHMFERMSEMAATLGISVIDQADYILRQGAKLTDAQWPHDAHWSPAGHQWAAEALLEYIEQRPEVCDG